MSTFVRRTVCAVALAWCLIGSAAFAGTIYGQVVTTHGLPVPATISFVDEATGKTETVKPDARGHYEVTLPAGTYRIVADSRPVSPDTVVVFHEPRQVEIVVGETK